MSCRDAVGSGFKMSIKRATVLWCRRKDVSECIQQGGEAKGEMVDVIQDQLMSYNC